MSKFSCNTIAWAFVIVATAFAIPAEARDRPGTPNQEMAFACKNSVQHKPFICFQFVNTARRDEDVFFWIEMTADGAKVDPSSFNVTCDAGDSPYDLICIWPRRGSIVKGSPLFNSTVWGGQSSYKNIQIAPDRHRDANWINMPVRVMLKDMEFDVEYCFRAMAVEQDSGVTSEIWSNWACATAPTPAAPRQPYTPQVSYIESDDGRGKPGGATPSVMLVEWDDPQPNYLGWYDILPAGADLRDYPLVYSNHTNVQLEPGKLTEVQIPVSGRPYNAIGYMVCASNIAHRVCSSPGFYQGSVARSYEDLQQKTAEAPSVAVSGAAEMKKTTESAKSVVFGAPRNVAATAPTYPDVKSSAPAAASPDGCRAGFVRRSAGPLDTVCAPPASRDRVADENRQADSRRNPNGAYGPNTCISGFVWREAYPGDVTCVTPESRDLIRLENGQN